MPQGQRLRPGPLGAVERLLPAGEPRRVRRAGGAPGHRLPQPAPGPPSHRPPRRPRRNGRAPLARRARRRAAEGRGGQPGRPPGRRTPGGGARLARRARRRRDGRGERVPRVGSSSGWPRRATWRRPAATARCRRRSRSRSSVRCVRSTTCGPARSTAWPRGVLDTSRSPRHAEPPRSSRKDEATRCASTSPTGISTGERGDGSGGEPRAKMRLLIKSAWGSDDPT